MFIRLIFLLFLSITSVHAVTTAVMDHMPLGYLENNKPKGILYEVMRHITKGSPEEVHIKLIPFMRMETMLAEKKLDFLLTFKNPILSKNMKEGPVLFNLPFSVCATPDKFEKKKLNMTIVRSLALPIDLFSKGLGKEITPVYIDRLPQAFPMMEAGRADGMLADWTLAHYEMQKRNIKNMRCKVVHTMEAIFYYNPNLDKTFVKHLIAKSKEIKKIQLYQQIIKQYGIPVDKSMMAK
jgi:hypothetical protein